jgi:hypothetical protein
MSWEDVLKEEDIIWPEKWVKAEVVADGPHRGETTIGGEKIILGGYVGQSKIRGVGPIRWKRITDGLFYQIGKERLQ